MPYCKFVTFIFQLVLISMNFVYLPQDFGTLVCIIWCCVYSFCRTLKRPCSISQYSSMALRLSDQNCKFFMFLLSLNSQKRLGYEKNNTKYRSLTWKPLSHVRILIYRTWPIINCSFGLLSHGKNVTETELH